MSEIIPKAVKVENISNILAIQFDNGKTKYLRSHYVKEITDAFSLSKGKGKRINLLAASTNMWIGSEYEIEEDGTVVMNGKDRYSPEELWQQSAASIPQL